MEHGYLLEGRHGAGDESAGRDLTGHGEEDYLVAGRRDYRHQRSADEALAGERLEAFGYDGLFDRRRGQPLPKRVPLAVVVRCSAACRMAAGHWFRNEKIVNEQEVTQNTPMRPPGRDCASVHHVSVAGCGPGLSIDIGHGILR